LKIVIKKNGEIIDVAHHPKEIVYEGNTVTLRDINTLEGTNYKMASKEEPKLQWFQCKGSGKKEILVEFEVE